MLRPSGRQLDEYVAALEAGVDKELARTEIFPDVRPKLIISELPDGTAVGWDTCAVCSQHLSTCPHELPTAPAIIRKWMAEGARSTPVQTMEVKSDVPAG